MRTLSPEEMHKVISYKKMNTEFAVGYDDAISKFHKFCEDKSRDNFILTYMCGGDSKDHKLCFVFEKEVPSSMKIAVIDSIVPSSEQRSVFTLLREFPKKAKELGFKDIDTFINKYKRLGAAYGCCPITISDVEIATKLLQDKSLFTDLQAGIINEIKTQEEGCRFYSGDLHQNLWRFANL